MTRSFEGAPAFEQASRRALDDTQLRANLARATRTIRRRRDAVVGELRDFAELREAAAAIKDDALNRLDDLLGELAERFEAAGGAVHFARDAAEANRIVVGLVQATGAAEVVKVKSMTTAEIGLNAALEAAGIDVAETDLAELIVQLGDDLPSHIVVPAIHRNRSEIRATFKAHMGAHGRPAPEDLSDEPAELAAAARLHLRERFLRAKVAISGANFAIAETGSLAVVESEGNGRMCLTLPETLISVVGIDKVLPRFADLEVFLQLLARSATGERMNPYTSIWRGARAGDGPAQLHLVLLDNGRTAALADPVGRQALRCIRCAACLNVCPVYERVGGHAYGSVYPGPIGAVLTPQLDAIASDEVTRSLPYASTLCGACYEACPVGIDIPRLLVHLRARVVEHKAAAGPTPESVAMAAAAYTFGSPRRLELAERAGGMLGLRWPGQRIRRLPGPMHAWTDARDAPLPARESFRQWWRREHGAESSSTSGEPHVAPASSLLGSVRDLFPARHRAPAPSPGLRAEDLAAGDAREEVLTRIRQALDHAGTPAPLERRYRRAGELQRDPASRRALFVSRLEDYTARVAATGAAGLSARLAEVLAEPAAAPEARFRVLVPADLPASWREALKACGAEVIVDDAELGVAELAAADATVSGCALGIAETGTLVLDGGAAQGRRALSLLTDHLVVLCRLDQIVDGVPDAIARLDPLSTQTWISGPSATSDIELSRVEGVHGPRRLDVILLEGA